MSDSNIDCKFKEGDFVEVTLGFYRGQRKQVKAFIENVGYLVSTSNVPGHTTWIEEKNLKLSKNQNKSFWRIFLS